MSTRSRTRLAGTSLRRAAVGGAAFSIAAATAIAGAGVANATATFSFDRIAGADRYGTSALTAKTFGTSDNAILASGVAGSTVDALSSAYLAGVKKAPVLLTQKDATPKSVLDQLAANKVKNIFVVGGNRVISEAQIGALTSAGYTVTRVSGADRYGTSAAVIETAGTPSGKTALLASGTVFPDALGAGALSYAAGVPLAITNPLTLSPQTLTALKGAGVTDVVIVGGSVAVTPTVVGQLVTAGFTVDPNSLAGKDRSDTSTKLAAYEMANFPTSFNGTGVNVASGAPTLDGADALGGATLSGQQGRPLLITANTNNAGTIPAYLTKNSSRLEKGTIFGGDSAVSPAVAEALTAAARIPTATPAFNPAQITVNNSNSATLGDGTNPPNTAIAAEGLAIPITPTDIITFRYTLLDGAKCIGGAPRAFVTVGGKILNSVDPSPGTNVTSASACGTPVAGEDNTFDVSYSLTAGGTVTEAALVLDNGFVADQKTAQVTVSDFVVAGQKILFG